MLSTITCKAQTYPLNTYYEDVPNYSYMKDLDNFLPPYVGIYKAIYQDNETTLYITYNNKELIDTGLGNRKYYQDVLYIAYTVKKLSTGSILQDTRNPADPKRNEIISIKTNTLDNNSIALLYSGTNCGVGWGRITLKKISENQISWSYYPNSTMLVPGECANLDKKVYLPVTENLIFTKQ